ncbi:MAG: hypothetical protein MR938_04925 [Tenericutes bacterium]|nr:hypothetical protein [Mycoplasmatota bacterium]
MNSLNEITDIEFLDKLENKIEEYKRMSESLEIELTTSKDKNIIANKKAKIDEKIRKMEYDYREYQIAMTQLSASYEEYEYSLNPEHKTELKIIMEKIKKMQRILIKRNAEILGLCIKNESQKLNIKI